MGKEVFCGQSSTIQSALIAVESELSKGFDGLQIIGNVSEVCRNGIERARSALFHTGIKLPQRRIVVSASPADVRKDGSQFDLAFAVCLGLLACPDTTIDGRKWLFAAELSLTGELRPVKSVISFALTAIAAGLEGIVVAAQNVDTVNALHRFNIPGGGNFKVMGFLSLRDVFAWLHGHTATDGQPDRHDCESWSSDRDLTFDDMVLSEELATAAAAVAHGRHNLMLYGSPGTGKSMFAARLASILPDMRAAEHMEALMINSFCNETLPKAVLAGRPPYRSPHHQATTAAILGTPYRPGELSLAHGGLIFLDEMPEFRRDIIEALREPMENGEVQVSRAKDKVRWSARTTLVGAMNNCPCGWAGSNVRTCKCSTSHIVNYKKRISGPILDRIEIHLNMPDKLPEKSLLFRSQREHGGGTGAKLAEAVNAAQEFAKARNDKLGVCANGNLSASQMVAASGLPDDVFYDMIDRHAPGYLSNRGIIRSLRVARTLADLGHRPSISADDFRGAIAWQAESAAASRSDDCMGFSC